MEDGNRNVTTLEPADSTTVRDKPDRIVPLRRQYLQIKQRFPDVILFFRLGDFYETFEDDAKIASSVLDIVLTSREMGKGVRVPLAGIPYHAAEGYIARLIAAGHKVAVCEQIGDPAKSKGLVERDVTRVVTPGTVVEPSMLDGHHNNYIAAVVPGGKRVGLAVADITTGEFTATEIAAGSDAEAILAAGRELIRWQPVELVMAAGSDDAFPMPAAAWLPEGIALSKTDAWRWKPQRASEALQQHFKVESLDGFGIGAKPVAIQAAGGLLDYLAETQRSGLHQITTLTSYSVDGFMTLDPQTVRNLELHESSRGDRRHSLIAVLDQTRTAMGARLLRRWLGQPLLDLDELTVRQDAVQRFVDDTQARAALRDALMGIGDLERLANRALQGIASPRDLGNLRSSLQVLPQVDAIAGPVPGGGLMPDTSAIYDLLAAAIVDDPPALLGKNPALRPGYAAELDGHRARAREAREWIANLERAERDLTGIKSLKVGYNKVFGYYLEITTAALASTERERLKNGNQEPVVPADYIAKQTISNATRYFTPQLKEYETIVLTAQETLNDLEAAAFRQVMAEVASHAPALLEAAGRVAWLDLVSNMAEVAIVRHYVRPQLETSGVIAIEKGRHPTLEAMMPAGEYVPNDAQLDTGSDQIIILTGPNMAGKSSWLRQVALIVLMAQIGSFVPAERARIGLVDRIFTRIGAQDDIATGQSTFMVEMLETANILNHATERSLVVLDEIGRGTSTYDGLAIARAVVEYLHNSPKLGCKTLFATHYHELTELDQILPRVRSYRMDVLEESDRVVFLRQVVPGGADRSYGIHVAELAGIPRAVVRRAHEVLAELEADSSSNDRQRRRQAMANPAPEADMAMQLTLFGAADPVVEVLKALDVEALSPLEAITKLFELQRQAGGAP